MKVRIETTNNRTRVFTEAGELHHVTDLKIEYHLKGPPTATIEQYATNSLGKFILDGDGLAKVTITNARVSNIVCNWDFTQ